MENRYYTLITGASEGLGKSLAMECARRKMNLVLIALPGVELTNLSSMIRMKYDVDVIPIAKDLCSENSCVELFGEVMNLNIHINMLVNNAGIGSTCLFEEGDVSFFERQIKLNVLATTMITRLFLAMLKRTSPSYILNVGSLASYFPIPQKQVYGATKSYIYYFSNCLREELKKDKVFVSVLCPGPLNTNARVKAMIKKGNYLIRTSSLDPDDTAGDIITGLLNKKRVMVPGLLNKCYLILYTLLPDFVKAMITNPCIKRLTTKSQECSDLRNDENSMNTTTKLMSFANN
jgi:uncharacterized protein